MAKETSKVLALLEALRAGKPIEVAATDAGLPEAVARCVAGSPLARALTRPI